ncbi:MAG: hypothetical protein ACOYMI_08650 [Phycisphaerales bacterium]
MWVEAGAEIDLSTGNSRKRIAVAETPKTGTSKGAGLEVRKNIDITQDRITITAEHRPEHAQPCNAAIPAKAGDAMSVKHERSLFRVSNQKALSLVWDLPFVLPRICGHHQVRTTPALALGVLTEPQS